MGTNDLYTKEIGSAMRLGRLRSPANGAIKLGWQARRRQLAPVLVDFGMLVLAAITTEAVSHGLRSCPPRLSRRWR
jgi:hypothetical protein